MDLLYGVWHNYAYNYGCTAESCQEKRMLTQEASEKALKRLFRRQLVVELEALYEVLGNPSRRSVTDDWRR